MGVIPKTAFNPPAVKCGSVFNYPKEKLKLPFSSTSIGGSGFSNKTAQKLTSPWILYARGYLIPPLNESGSSPSGDPNTYPNLRYERRVGSALTWPKFYLFLWCQRAGVGLDSNYPNMLPPCGSRKWVGPKATILSLRQRAGLTSQRPEYLP